jgi:cyanophycinase
MTGRSVLAATLLLLVGAVGAAETLIEERGHLILNGGGSRPAVVMETFIELAGGPGASIVVFPTASELADTGEVYRDLFEKEYGCTGVWVAAVVGPEDARDRKLADRVRGANGIWFAGGDQRRITTALAGSPVGAAVRAAFEAGAVVGGTSAGTAAQSELMITGDGNFTVIARETVEYTAGMGLFPGVIVDQHFVARRRQNRLISMVLEHPELLGVGVDEATAVWVRPDGTFKVLGDGWVMVYDASGARITAGARPDGRTALGVRDLKTHVLLPGELFDVPGRRPLESDPWIHR